jgi:hypothetical protein
MVEDEDGGRWVLFMKRILAVNMIEPLQNHLKPGKLKFLE